MPTMTTIAIRNRRCARQVALPLLVAATLALPAVVAAAQPAESPAAPASHAQPASDHPAPAADPHAPPAADAHAQPAGEHGATASHGAGEAEHGEPHGESIWVTLARFANFAILAGVIYWLARKPLANHLASRGAQIRKDLVDAAETRATATARLADIEAKLAALPGELEQLRLRGAEELEAERARLSAAAQTERDRLVDQARREIETQTRIARRATAHPCGEPGRGGRGAALARHADPGRAGPTRGPVRRADEERPMTSLEAKRAGRALFQATQPTGQARITLDGLLAFADLLEQHADLREAFGSVFVPAELKAGVVGQVADLLATPKAARQMLILLAQSHQAAGLAGIIRELKALVHREERRVDAEVTTAMPLDQAQVALLRDALAAATGQQVTVSTRVDPAVIGGAVTRVGSVVYDGSLARQLARMKEQFVQQG